MEGEQHQTWVLFIYFTFSIGINTEKILNSARINQIITMESLRIQLDYAGMKFTFKKEPRLIS